MGLRVIITPTALADLESIVRFIALDSPARAKRFGYQLIEAALSLGAFPEMGCVSVECSNPNIREIVHGNYRLIYEIKSAPSSIYLLRFWHAARGVPPEA